MALDLIVECLICGKPLLYSVGDLRVIGCHVAGDPEDSYNWYCATYPKEDDGQSN